jgi:large subunit ribosomal protein L29
MASIVELREMGYEKIEEMLENSREELFNLRFQHASARLDDVSRLRKVRREIAQLETVLHMRQLAIEAALGRPEVVEALLGKDWQAEAHFSYEDSAWKVSFLGSSEDELTQALVNLNQKKQKRGHRARKQANSVGKRGQR